MKKLYIFGAIAIIIILAVFGGCNNTKPATTTPATTTPATTTTEETPVSIEVELELAGSETYSLVAVYELEASATLSQAVVSGTVTAVRYARANIVITAEFYDASGALVGTIDQDYIMDSSIVIRSLGFELLFYNDDHAQIEKCVLIVDAKE